MSSFLIVSAAWTQPFSMHILDEDMKGWVGSSTFVFRLKPCLFRHKISETLHLEIKTLTLDPNCCCLSLLVNLNQEIKNSMIKVTPQMPTITYCKRKSQRPNFDTNSDYRYHLPWNLYKDTFPLYWYGIRCSHFFLFSSLLDKTAFHFSCIMKHTPSPLNIPQVYLNAFPDSVPKFAHIFKNPVSVPIPFSFRTFCHHNVIYNSLINHKASLSFFFFFCL
jgi:hypothetical protein